MTPFVVGHATHPQWSGALALVIAQLEAQLETQRGETGTTRRADDVKGVHGAQGAQGAQNTEGAEPTLGWVYFTDAYASAAAPLLAALRKRWPEIAFVGTVGVGVAAAGVEYFDEPGLVVMLASLPRSQFQVFSGQAGLRGAGAPLWRAATALVHADPATADLAELLAELAERTETGYLFGGVAASRGRAVQLADGVFEGGLSGVAFGPGVHIVSRVTQGCMPLGPTRRVTASDGTVVLALDGRPALPQLLRDLALAGSDETGAALPPARLRAAVPRLRRTLVGLTGPAAADVATDAADVSAGAAGHSSSSASPAASPARARPRGSFGEEVRVRHLIGVDPARQAFAVAERVLPGMGLAFCERDAAAARRDLMRMCTEVRDEVETRAEALHAAAPAASPAPTAPAMRPAVGSEQPHADTAPAPRIAGALYFSCSGRGGPHFGGPSAELQLVRHALGDVPLAGFFAAGEIAHRQLYGYTGVLTVFTD
ncbi:MAG: FIST C-terminal domain-containing protein [Rubrivivax sp.]|nr:FIST C-terminal domain-containing protein [Rubrivivax sp.]